MSTKSTIEECQTAITSLLPEHYPMIGEVAGRLGMSVRTFQRRLGQFGLSYSQLVENTRRERACRLLRKGNLKLSVVAGSIGYTDPSSFTRAFRRWKGVPPSVYQRSCSTPSADKD